MLCYNFFFFFVAGARTQMMMARTTSILWANAILKRWGAVLSKVKASISFGNLSKLCSTLLFGSMKLFPTDMVVKGAEKSSWVLLHLRGGGFNSLSGPLDLSCLRSNWSLLPSLGCLQGLELQRPNLLLL